MADIGLPKIDIIFKGLGVSAIKRGSKGTVVLIVKDSTDKSFVFKEYKDISDLSSDELASYTPENQQYITDCLGGTPKKLVVARMDSYEPEGESTLNDLLAKIKGKVEMNCWISIAGGIPAETDALVSFVKSSNKNHKKRYKAFVYKATISDDMHIVNFTNEKVTFKDERGEVGGNEAIPYLLGFIGGLSLDMSSIAYVLQKFESVVEPEDVEIAINKGEFVLFNDEGEVYVARGVNSLTTTGQNITDDMKFILIVEVMDLIYTDIFTTWKKFYKGKYKNYLDNQMLLVGAINSYFEGMANDLLLDPQFKNKSKISITAQRLANVPKYGEEEVGNWDEDKILRMTVGTNVYLAANIKILNAMEDFEFTISM